MEKQQNIPAQAARQRMPRQNMQQKRVMRHKNNTVRILLWIILAVQLICTIELFVLIRVLAADKDTDSAITGANSIAQEVNFVDNSKGTEGSAGEAGGQKTQEEDDWQLTLVNKWNPMEDGYEPELTELAEGHMVDSRIADALMDMIEGAREAGYSIYILSAYRSMDKQTYLYEAEVAEWLNLGYSQSGAEAKAGTVVAVPGTSEHQLGLAVDLVSSEYVQLDEGAEKTLGYKWLVNHCQEYGFILRYPNGKTDITGIIYEPWHFRYVGKEAAKEIMEKGLTLEEYLEQL